MIRVNLMPQFSDLKSQKAHLASPDSVLGQNWEISVSKINGKKDFT
jgi:hypothetical protein